MISSFTKMQGRAIGVPNAVLFRAWDSQARPAILEELQAAEALVRQALDSLEGRWRASHGAERISLQPTHDALAYVWTERGISCVFLDKKKKAFRFHGYRWSLAYFDADKGTFSWPESGPMIGQCGADDRMYHAGTRFVAVGCLMPALVREISETAGSGRRS